MAVLRPAAAHTLWQEWPQLDPDLVREVHAAGVRVIAWTVNDAGVARQLAAAGVDGLCTDRPGWLRQAVADRR